MRFYLNASPNSLGPSNKKMNTPTPPTTSSASYSNSEGRGNGNGRRRNGNNNQGGRGSHGNGPNSSRNTSTFSSCCDGLKGHFFDCSDHSQAQQFSKTLDELAENVVCESKIAGGAACTSIRQIAMSTIPAPSGPPINATPTETEIWKQLVTAYVKKLGHIEENP